MATLWHRLHRLDVIECPAHVVVGILELVALDVERIAARTRPLAEQHTLRATWWDLDLGGDAVPAVEHSDRGVPRHRLRVREVGVAGTVFRKLRALLGKALQTTPVDRQDLVLARLHVPGRDHVDQLLAIGSLDVVVLGGVLGHVVELPPMGVQLGQRLG